MLNTGKSADERYGTTIRLLVSGACKACITLVKKDPTEIGLHRTFNDHREGHVGIHDDSFAVGDEAASRIQCVKYKFSHSVEDETKLILSALALIYRKAGR